MLFLEQNYPNPFNPVTKITFGIPKQAMKLKIFDMSGRKWKTLISTQRSRILHSEVSMRPSSGLASGAVFLQDRNRCDCFCEEDGFLNN
ncbi:MAG: T9SS type A sorting domain-containing protein [Ignavibacteria bacterium]|nr:T9SS type A sorting domain-containing protein [Ignavibacteria bacterium]